MFVENSHLQNIMQIYNLSPLIKKPTCFQSHNPTCIDNFLTNQEAMFKLSRLFESGSSDHHKLISAVMKSGIFRGPPRKKVYSTYKNFALEHFKMGLKNELEKLNNSTHNVFKTVCSVMNKDAPIKLKILRHNNNFFMTKNVRKEMQRSIFKKHFNKCCTYEN